ncbi:MAG: metallophosphoesterase [archaeon]
MKFLLIGDFHGKIYPKLNKIKDLDFDYVLCTGDLSSDGGLRKYIFKYWKKLDKIPLEYLIGKKKIDEANKQVSKSLIKVLKFLSSLNRKTFLIRGNFDLEHTRRNKKESNLTKKSLSNQIKKYKQIKLIGSKIIKLKNNSLIIHSGYRFPTEKGLEKYTFLKYTERGIEKRNQQWNNRLKKLFSKVKDFNNSIFLIHDPPRGYLDIVKNKKSPLNNKHIGDEYYLRYIKKYQPLITICGHMHEYQNKIKIGKTTLINPGPAFEGKFAILETSNNRLKSLKFYK